MATETTQDRVSLHSENPDGSLVGHGDFATQDEAIEHARSLVERGAVSPDDGSDSVCFRLVRPSGGSTPLAIDANDLEAMLPSSEPASPVLTARRDRSATLIVELPGGLKGDLERLARLDGESMSHVVRRLIREEARRRRGDR